MFEGLDTEQKAVSIPYYVHEGEMARVERLNKRWFIAFLIVLLMLFASNIGWIVYEHQFETYMIQQDVDTGEGYTLLTGIGDVNQYGTSSSGYHGQSAENK